MGSSVGVLDGCEAAIHAARRFMQATTTDSIIPKPKSVLSNALSSLNRCHTCSRPSLEIVLFYTNTAIVHTVARRRCASMIFSSSQRRAHMREIRWAHYSSVCRSTLFLGSFTSTLAAGYMYRRLHSRWTSARSRKRCSAYQQGRE